MGEECNYKYNTKEYHRIKQREWARKNPDKIKQYRENWRKKNPGKRSPTNPETLKKWKQEHKEEVYASKQKYYAKTAFSKNCGNHWEPWEVEMVLEHSIPDAEISEFLGRSVKSIQIKRSRIKGKCPDCGFLICDVCDMRGTE